MVRLDTNGAVLAPGQYIWTQSHADCSTPHKPCEVRSTWTGTMAQTIVYECGKVKNVSYVNSSRYESESAVQTAERKIEEAKAALAQAHENLQKAKRSTRFGIEPGNGSMLKIEKRYDFGGRAYYYGAIRVGNKWYMTCSGGYQKSPMSWDELKSFIGDSKFWVPRNYDQAPSS